MKSSLPAKTKAKSHLFEQLVDQIGCAVCLFVNETEGSKGAIHHITENGRRISHWHVLPLCKYHHQYGFEGQPSIHSHSGKHGGKAEFKRVHGVDEYDLLERCEEYLDRYYSEGDQ